MTSLSLGYREGVLDYQLRHREDFVELLSAMVSLETPSLDRDKQQPILELLQSKFLDLGHRVRQVRGPRSGGHLLALPAQRVRQRPYQLMLGHCDTVWPLGTLEKMPLRVDEGWIQGPGVYDMKAGVAMILFALQTIQALGLEPPLDPVVFINSDEEVGSFESTSHIRRLARGAARCFVLEPSLGPQGQLKTARKGVGAFHVTVTGQAAHAGLEPERGASAILELSYVIQKLFALSNPETQTTVNVGMIDGGIRPNVIAPQSRARVDVRVLSAEEGERVTEAIAAITATTPGVKVEITGGIGRPPLEPTARNLALWTKAKELGRQLGLELESGVAGGGSDGNTTSLFTATLDGLGAVGRGAHADDEAVALDRTLERAALLTLLILQGDVRDE